MMRIGDLRHKITLQSQTSVPDGLGGETVTWSNVADIYAAVWPVGATEAIQAGQESMTVTHRIRTRYRVVGASWRIKFGTRYFAIVSVINPSERGVMLDILCKEASS